MRTFETINIEYNGQKIEVSGMYSEGVRSSYFTAPESPEFEIKEIMWKNLDVTDLLDHYDISEKCLEELIN